MCSVRMACRVCPVCQRPFRPARREQVYDRRQCWYREMRRRQRGQMREAMARAMAAKIAKCRARQRAALYAAFGELSERECALVRLALARGYQRGYRVARREQRLAS